MAPEKKLDINVLNKKLAKALYVYSKNDDGYPGEIIRGVQVDLIKDLLGKGADVNLLVATYPFNEKETLLMRFLAIPNLVEFLIDKGADVNLITDSGGRSPLQNAVSYGDRAEEVNDDDGDASPLQNTVGYSDSELYACTARLLVNAGADVNASQKGYETVLMTAVKVAMNPSEKWPGMVHLLVEKGANIEATDRNGKTALQRLLAASEEPRAILERVDAILRFLQKG